MTADQTPTPPAARIQEPARAPMSGLAAWLRCMARQAIDTDTLLAWASEVDAALAQQPAAAQAKSEALRRYLSDTLQGGTANEKTVARTALRLLDSVAAPQQEAERQPLSEEHLRDAFMTTNTRSYDATYAAFRDGVRFAERAHRIGITGPATQETKHG